MSGIVPDSDMPDSVVPDSDLPADPSAAPPETVGRVTGLAARGVATGAAGLPDTVSMLADPLAYFAGKAIRNATGEEPTEQPGTPYKPQLSDFVHPDKWQEAANYFADKAGMPKPETPGERIGYAAAQALPSAALAPEAPVLSALSAAGGAAASQTVAENGGSPLQQTLAGLAVGSVPALGTAAAGLTRTIARGAGSDAAAAMNARIADAAAAGTTLTAGQAGGSRVVQALENTSGRLWGGGSVAKNAENQTAQLESSVNGIVENLNPKGAALTPTGAGEAINKGVAATKQSMRDAETAAYSKVDQLVPGTAPMDVSASAQKAAELAAPTSNEALNAATVSPKINAVNEALAAYPDSTMPYADLTRLRTHVGGMIDRGFAPADPQTNGALKQLYGSLTDDLNTGAGAVSPEAQAAVQDASTLYKANKAQRDTLNKVVNQAGGPEAVFQAATGQTKAGATKIGSVLSALDPENANVVRATVLHRMGQAVPSAANPAGNFNANTLLTSWNRMSTEAKGALFGNSGASGDLRKSLDSITNTVGTLRNAGHTLANPSGSAGAAAHAFELWKLLEIGGGLAAGEHGVKALAGAAAAIPANMILSRALVNPRTARWIATTTKLPKHALPNAINQLSKMGKVDPDARDLSAALQAQQGGTRNPL